MPPTAPPPPPLCLLAGRAADGAIGCLLWGSYALLYPIPRRWLLGMAWAVSPIVASLFRWRVPCKNLRIIRSVYPEAGSGKSETELLALAVYHQLATILDLFKLIGHSPSALLAVVRLEGWETIESVMAKGRGAVLVSAHYANWELVGALLAARGLPMHAFYYQQLSPALDRFLAWARGRTGMRMLHQRRGLRECMRALKEGGAVGFVADQDGSKDGVFLDFFGRLVSMPRGPYEFARHAGCEVLPISSERLPDGSYSLRIGAPLAVATGEDAVAAAKTMAAIFESDIRDDPTQWQLFYDRFWLRHAPRLEELGLLDRAKAEHDRDADLSAGGSTETASGQPDPARAAGSGADSPSFQTGLGRGSAPASEGCGSNRNAGRPQLEGPMLVRIAFCFYLPFFLLALGWMAHRGRLAQLLWAGGRAELLEAIGLALLLTAATIVASRIICSCFKWGREMEQALHEVISGISPHSSVALAAISSVAEETVFRGALQPELGLVWASVLFGLVHFPIERRLRAWTLFALTMGFCLGGLFHATQGLLAPVLAHFLVNAVNLAWLAADDRTR